MLAFVPNKKTLLGAIQFTHLPFSNELLSKRIKTVDLISGRSNHVGILFYLCSKFPKCLITTSLVRRKRRYTRNRKTYKKIGVANLVGGIESFGRCDRLQQFRRCVYALHEIPYNLPESPAPISLMDTFQPRSLA